MSPTLFSERVNAVSSLITNMTIDPSERLGIATALCEIYRFELSKRLVVLPAPIENSATPVEDVKNENPAS